LPDGFDPNATGADVVGNLNSNDPDKAGLIGANRVWQSFGDILDNQGNVIAHNNAAYQGYVANVPLNSRLRFTFSGVMNQSTVPAPQFT
jgi:predicted xylose isomerase-like sugar epimerase